MRLIMDEKKTKKGKKQKEKEEEEVSEEKKPGFPKEVDFKKFLGCGG
ncbi:MAG: hypothetical protein RLN88_01460 [Ekhidna sp.]